MVIRGIKSHRENFGTVVLPKKLIEIARQKSVFVLRTQPCLGEIDFHRRILSYCDRGECMNSIAHEIRSGAI